MDNFCVGYKTLFLIDDSTADNTLDKKRQPLLEFSKSFVMAANPELYCYPEQFKTTSKDDVCLVS